MGGACRHWISTRTFPSLISRASNRQIMAEPTTDFLLFIGGFMQSRALSVQGMCGMAHDAEHRYRNAGVRVDYEPWKSDWASMAEWIFRWSGYDAYNPNGVEKPTIMVVAYSWGAGWGLTQLAEHLAVRGLHINVAIASDAVRHIGWQWSHTCGLSQVLAYFPLWSLEKPASIDQFHWFRQKRRRHLLRDLKNGTTWLYGHPWVEEKNGKWQSCPNGQGLDDYSHSNMDDAWQFRKKVFEVADELFLQKERAA